MKDQENVLWDVQFNESREAVEEQLDLRLLFLRLQAKMYVRERRILSMWGLV